ILRPNHLESLHVSRSDSIKREFPERCNQGFGTHPIVLVCARVSFMLFFGPGHKLVFHKVLELRNGTPMHSSCPAFCQLSPADGFGIRGCVLVGESGGFTVANPTKPEVVPVNTASLVNAHFRLLSRGSETETLQRSK